MATKFDAQVIIVQSFVSVFLNLVPLQVVILEHKSIICAGYSAVLHVHACVEEVQFVVSEVLCAVMFSVRWLNVDCRHYWHFWTKKGREASIHRGLANCCLKLSCFVVELPCRFVKQDQACIAQLQTAGVICLEEFSQFPSMGRFTLRDEGIAEHIHRCT